MNIKTLLPENKYADFIEWLFEAGIDCQRTTAAEAVNLFIADMVSKKEADDASSANS
jgi:hypothetical protein